MSPYPYPTHRSQRSQLVVNERDLAVGPFRIADRGEAPVELLVICCPNVAHPADARWHGATQGGGGRGSASNSRRPLTPHPDTP